MIKTYVPEEMDQLLARLWTVNPAPTTVQMMKLMSLTTLDEEARCESIRILMSRCLPSGDEVVSFLKAYPRYQTLVIGWLPVWLSADSHTNEESLALLRSISDQTLKELFGLWLLKGVDFKDLSYDHMEVITGVLREVPSLQEFAWSQMAKSLEGLEDEFLQIANNSPRLRERIAHIFVEDGRRVPGLTLALSIPSMTSAAVGKLFELGKPEGLIEIALSNEVGDSERHKASARLMNVEEKTPRMMYAVMVVDRNAEGFSRALDTFLALIQQREGKDDIPLIRECLELIDGMDVKWEFLNGLRSKLQDILDRLTRPSETEEVLQAIQQLVAPQSV